MADEHTPGPWEARTFLVMGGVQMSDRICHVGTSTSLGPPRSHETEANARLIAAAPDMLASLQEFLPILERQLNSVNPGGAAEASNAFQVAKARVDRMRAAIAKATA